MGIKKSIVILYAEVMPYNVVCFRSLIQLREVDLHVVCWGRDKKLTPYQPPAMEGLYYYDKNQYNTDKIIKLIDSVQPQCLYVSGRMESDYLEASKYARKKGIKVIGTSDNQFKGSLKQKVASLLASKLYRQYFDYMMVPGLYQYEYARHLGFGRNQILFPQYCADTTLFHSYYENKREKGIAKNTILFVGRLNKIKGISFLINAFLETLQEGESDLKLVIVGNGPERNSIPEHEKIVVHSFLDQSEIIKLLPEVRFFCLPSVAEPWGVVIHEFAAAGLPIVTTNIVGAATAFVKNQYNGILIKPGSKASLKEAIQFMVTLSESEITLMGRRSHELSYQITPELWATTIGAVANV